MRNKIAQLFGLGLMSGGLSKADEPSNNSLRTHYRHAPGWGLNLNQRQKRKRARQTNRFA